VTAGAPPPVMDRRALNRALLARQLLLERATATPAEVLERLVGMQAQTPLAPYVGLWSRLDGFRPESLAAMLTGRTAVRVPLMRTTLHLVTAADCLALRPLLQPVLDRGVRSNSPWARALAGLDLGPLLAAGREVLEARPRTVAELGPALQARWPDRDAVALAQAVRYMVPLVQLPPRGVWGAGGRPVWTTVEAWLGAPLAPDPDPAELVRRYLAAFGPATVKDVQAWSWLTRLRPVVERLRPELVTFRDEAGNELFDLPDAPRPDPATPAPPRFLPEYDNLLLSHDDRERVIARRHREDVFNLGALLVHGFVRGSWRIFRARRAASLRVALFTPLAKRDAAAVHAEGRRLLRFAAGEADARIELVAPG
jgi:Winged helix DNA-binding domain